MIVCDHCKDVSRPASECRVAVLSTPDRADGPRRASQVLAVPISLCAPCVGLVGDRIAKAVGEIKAGPRAEGGAGPEKAAPATPPPHRKAAAS